MTTTTVKRTNSKEVKAIIKAYILKGIDGEGYDLPKLPETEKEKLEFCLETFKAEYCYPQNLQRYKSYTKTFEEWLKGLPSAIFVDFENFRILELAKEWGTLAIGATEKQEDKVLENWFNLIAQNFMELCGKNNLSYILNN